MKVSFEANYNSSIKRFSNGQEKKTKFSIRALFMKGSFFALLIYHSEACTID